MARANIVKNLKIDKKFIKSLLDEHGSVQTLHILRNCYGGGTTTPNIADQALSLMVYNILNTMSVLEDMTGKQHININEITHLSQITEDQATRTISRHIMSGLDGLASYVQ